MAQRQASTTESDLPLLTADLPGSGGSPQEPEDFVVEEIPAYLPAGAGEHCFAWVEKRQLTTPQVVQQICSALGLSSKAAGYAGLKDKHGVTRQWLSFPGTTPEQLLAVQGEGFRVIEARLHGNKLKVGHLRGNRFTVTLRGALADGVARAQAVLERLGQQGLPNYYGQQRFGRNQDNVEQGLKLLTGAVGAPKDRFRRKLMISALQSEMFNQVLARRLRQGTLHRLLGGEVLQKTDTGGMFVSEDAAVDQKRLAQNQVVITGPMCGPRMPLPLEGSPARRLEEEVFAQYQVTPQQFSALGKLARGGRRPLSVRVESWEVLPREPSGELTLRFSLPAGSYATVLLQEVGKTAPSH